MNFSAASSSSLVVTPGRAFDRSIRRHRAWILPASAISSTCADVLRKIMPRYISPSLLFLSAEGRDDPVNPLLDLVRGLPAIHAVQDATLVVVVHQGLGLFAVLREAILDHLRLVVVADDQVGAVDVADPILLRWVELDVVDVARVLRAGAASAEPAQNFLLRDLDQDDRRHLPAKLRHLRVQRLSL